MRGALIAIENQGFSTVWRLGLHFCVHVTKHAFTPKDHGLSSLLNSLLQAGFIRE